MNNNPGLLTLCVRQSIDHHRSALFGSHVATEQVKEQITEEILHHMRDYIKITALTVDKPNDHLEATLDLPQLGQDRIDTLTRDLTDQSTFAGMYKRQLEKVEKEFEEYKKRPWYRKLF